MIPAEQITERSWRKLIRAVRSYVCRRVTNPEDREDLVQEVLLRVHRGLTSLKDQTLPGPWIFGIAHNAVVDHWRKRRRDVSVPINEAEINFGELVDETDDGDLLQQTVATYLADMVTQLESPYRETLMLTELQDMKYRDAARTLGISLAAVKSRVLRGREMLRQALTRCCEIELGAKGRVLECTPRGQLSRELQNEANLVEGSRRWLGRRSVGGSGISPTGQGWPQTPRAGRVSAKEFTGEASHESMVPLKCCSRTRGISCVRPQDR